VQDLPHKYVDQKLSNKLKVPQKWNRLLSNSWVSLTTTKSAENSASTKNFEFHFIFVNVDIDATKRFSFLPIFTSLRWKILYFVYFVNITIILTKIRVFFATLIQWCLKHLINNKVFFIGLTKNMFSIWKRHKEKQNTGY
jgi:hypothetical protein